jgi:chorismate synthase
MTLRFLTAGESHGQSLVTILEGIPAGLAISTRIIDKELLRRQKGVGAGPRMKIEKDSAVILSGVMEGVTTGAPIALQIVNRDHPKWRGKPIPHFSIPRPGHADLTGAIKYGYHDLRPSLERASARETASRVAAGAICKHFLHQFKIRIGGYVQSIGNVAAELDGMSYESRIDAAEESEVRCPEPSASTRMVEQIRKIMMEKNTLGGIIEVVALNLPPGLGSFMQWDRRLEARLGSAILSVQAVKGVEIGLAFDNARQLGTDAQDGIYLAEDKNTLLRRTNHSGGLEGGITTGEPLVVRAAMKPIATTLFPQDSVDLSTGEEVKTKYERSDFCPVPRAVSVLEAMVSYILADALIEKLGGDSMDEALLRYESLRKARLSDLSLDASPHTFWSDEDGISEEVT